MVSAVVFTGPSSEVKHPSSQYLHQLLRAANPSAAFIQAEGGAVTRWELTPPPSSSSSPRHHFLIIIFIIDVVISVL